MYIYHSHTIFIFYCESENDVYLFICVYVCAYVVRVCINVCIHYKERNTMPLTMYYLTKDPFRLSVITN